MRARNESVSTFGAQFEIRWADRQTLETVLPWVSSAEHAEFGTSFILEQFWDSAL